jgi:hypothetical protein
MAIVMPGCNQFNMTEEIQRKILDKLAYIAKGFNGFVGRDKIFARFRGHRYNQCTACGIDFYQARRSNWEIQINNITIPEIDGNLINRSFRIIFPCTDEETCLPYDPEGALLKCSSAKSPPCFAEGEYFCGNQVIAPATRNNYYSIVNQCNFIENSVVGFNKDLGIDWTLRSLPTDPITDTTFGFPIGSIYIPTPEDPNEQDFYFECDISCQLDFMDSMSGLQPTLKDVIDGIISALCCNVFRTPFVYLTFTDYLISKSVRVWFKYPKVPGCEKVNCFDWEFTLTTALEGDIAFATAFMNVIASEAVALLNSAINGFGANLDTQFQEKLWTRTLAKVSIDPDDRNPIVSVDILDNQ